MVRFILSLLIMFLFSGCFFDNEPLKLGTSPWIGYEGIYQAKEFGWIDDRVELVEGKLASETFKRLMDGEIDAATITIDDVLVAKSKGIDLTIIAVLDISAGSDIILSKTPMKNLSELRGKKIAMDNAALGSLMLTKMLEKAYLTEKDVTVVYIPPHLQDKAWENNEIDVAITYEPYASKLLDKGAHYLLSTHDFPETIFDVLVVRTDKIKGRENTIQTLVDGHFKSLEYLHINYQDFVYRIASRQDITPDDVKRTLGGVILPSKAANQSYLTPDSRLMVALNELNKVMSARKFISHKVPLTNLFDSSYLKEDQ